ncbi:MAG: restriction endonuclease [Clostridia bacterium]|nr:restriction endonuclease [Clostridia bacterium]
MDNLPYKRNSKSSIAQYALNLKEKTFKDVLLNDPNISDEDRALLFEYYNNPRSKGSLGQLIEKHFFFYNPNSSSEADFNEAGVELKVTPYLIKSKGDFRAKERLVLTIINYMNDYKEEDFLKSHVYEKCALMLLVYYLYEPNKERLDYLINYIKLFQFPEEDLEIIKNDYKIIIDKIKNGKAEEISESDTNYLGACTKGANANSLREQPFSNVNAMQRAFCLKNSYMTYILNHYIVNQTDGYESVIKDANILKKQTLEQYIIDRLAPYYNQDIEYLKHKFDIPYQVSNKSFTYLLAKGMLNVVNDKIEEFEKANIKIKAIRLRPDGMPKECMSFPAFKYLDIINETWLDSELYETFSTTKYLFMIYQYTDDDTLIFKKSMFWHVPEKDLNTEIKRVWETTVEKIKNNEYDSLPRIKESPILHVRPHAQNAQDTYPTPDGKHAIKKCFWLNASYIKKQIEESED